MPLSLFVSASARNFIRSLSSAQSFCAATGRTLVTRPRIVDKRGRESERGRTEENYEENRNSGDVKGPQRSFAIRNLATSQGSLNLNFGHVILIRPHSSFFLSLPSCNGVLDRSPNSCAEDHRPRSTSTVRWFKINTPMGGFLLLADDPVFETQSARVPRYAPRTH